MRVKNENSATFDEVTGKWYFNPECKLHAGILVIATISLICISPLFRLLKIAKNAVGKTTVSAIRAAPRHV